MIMNADYFLLNIFLHFQLSLLMIIEQLIEYKLIFHLSKAFDIIVFIVLSSMNNSRNIILLNLLKVFEAMIDGT